MKRYACFLLLAIATPALAGPRPDRPPPPPRPDFASARQHERDDLTLVLGLTAAQQTALAAMLGSDARPDRPMLRPDGMPDFAQRLADQERLMGERDARRRAHVAAMRSFYAALDPHQRLVFEALMRLRHAPDGPGPHGPPDGHAPDDGGPGGE